MLVESIATSIFCLLLLFLQSFLVFVDQVHVSWSSGCNEHVTSQHQRILRSHNRRHFSRVSQRPLRRLQLRRT